RMKTLTINELKQLYIAGHLSEELVEDLRSDKRKGVQRLIATYERDQEKMRERIQNFDKMQGFEQSYRKSGKRYIAGVDEAGRGPLAGPVVAAAVILPEDFRLIGLTDSKQLNEEERNKYAQIIKEEAV